MKKETGRMSKRSEKGFLDQGFTSYLLYLFWLFTAGLSLPPFYPPSICQTDSCWLTPSPSLIQPKPLGSSVSFQICFYISLPSSLSPRVLRNSPGQKVKEVLGVGSMRTSETSVCSLFCCLYCWQCSCLSCHRLDMYKEPERSREYIKPIIY